MMILGSGCLMVEVASENDQVCNKNSNNSKRSNVKKFTIDVTQPCGKLCGPHKRVVGHVRHTCLYNHTGILGRLRGSRGLGI